MYNLIKYEDKINGKIKRKSKGQKKIIIENEIRLVSINRDEINNLARFLFIGLAVFLSLISFTFISIGNTNKEFNDRIGKYFEQKKNIAISEGDYKEIIVDNIQDISRDTENNMKLISQSFIFIVLFIGVSFFIYMLSLIYLSKKDKILTKILYKII